MRLAGGVLLIATAAAAAAWTLGGAAIARLVPVPLGLNEDPFRITLSGPLWSDRTLRDGEGRRDIACLTRDEQLTVSVAGCDGARISALSYRVDGGPIHQLSACSAASCPRPTTVTTTPRLRRLGPGTHRLAIAVSGRAAAQSSGATLEVTVGDRLPLLREGEPVTAPAPSTAAPGSAAVIRATREIIGREIRSGVLRRVVGSATPRFVQIGELRGAGRPVGGTALLALPVALHGVRATVPGYVIAAGGYRSQSVRFTTTQLRDLLVDVDLRRRG
jgi:hypothetical protein